ncbi:hypothetical protein B0H11DRAFT_596027 [Mycena galericulata]|nr:hypothetical protein B0H11DRAFT_596027 [Mycena galericulata]
MRRGLRRSPYYLHHQWRSTLGQAGNLSRVRAQHAWVSVHTLTRSPPRCFPSRRRSRESGSSSSCRWVVSSLHDGARRGAQAAQDATPPAVKEKLGQAAVAINKAAGFVGVHAQRGGQAAVVGVRRGAQFVEDATPPVVKEKIGAAADTARRGAQAIEDATPPAVKQKIGQASVFIDTLPAPVTYGVLGAAGAAVLVAPLAPAILGGIYGIGAAGPVAGGAFAGIQASGAVVAGSSWAAIQSIAMGGALPLIGTVSAGAIGGAAGVVGGAVASHARGTNGTDVAAGSDAGGPGGGGPPDEKDNLGEEEGTEIEGNKSGESTLPVSAEKSKL